MTGAAPSAAAPDTRHWDRGATFDLVAMTALLLFSLVLTVYRLTLPTDGWLATEPNDFDARGFIYQANLMGLPSDLRPGDHLLAVEGIPFNSDIVTASWRLRDEWRAGNSLRYSVVRDGQALELDVPLTHWRLADFWRGTATAENLIWYVSSVLFVVVALLAFWRRPDSRAARALWVLAAVELTVVQITTLVPAMASDSAFAEVALSINLLIFATFTVLLPPALIRFALVFPEPIPPLARRPWLALVPYAVGLLVMVAFLTQQYVFGWLWTAASVLIALALLVYSALIRRDAVSRAQLRWGLGGTIIGLALFFVTYIPVFLDVPAAVTSVLDTLS
ncbi:MAG TPA: hypothetical protein PK829_13565, partial [Promineifilum sp.]|nr:hypothetical protein [Promineifilum sp.]